MTRALLAAMACLGIGIATFGAGTQSAHAQQTSPPVPKFKVDPDWPKPLPQVKDSDGQMRRWVTGAPGGICTDSHDHIITLNRSWLNDPTGGLVKFEAMAGVIAPPVVVYDTEGKVVSSWGDASFVEPNGPTKVMPEASHGCFVDYEGNIWIAGSMDGVVQKYTSDGSKMLLQIGTKGVCDGEPNQSPKAFNPSCGENADHNSSRTLLNDPAGVWVDSNPDPVTKQRGSIYIADGYGNHRIVVFDSKGKFLRQWGTAGDGPGQFSKLGGGHPHCVALSKDGLVYACDRGSSRVYEFDRLGALKRTIAIDPEGGLKAPMRASDVTFSNDPQQTYMYVADLGNAVIHIFDRAKGTIVGQIGVGPGRQAGELLTPHQLAVDSHGNVYVAETIDARRVQRFVKQ